MNNLTSADLAAFARLGISAEMLKRAGVKRVTDAEARELQHHTRTLDRWWARGKGPRRFRLGKKVLYSREAVMRWLAEQAGQPCRKRSTQK